MQEVFIYLDDSGCIAAKERYFVYGGLIFCNEEEREACKLQINNFIADHGIVKEMKGTRLSEKTTQALFAELEQKQIICGILNVRHISSKLTENAISKVHLKDYILTELILEAILVKIESREIDIKQKVKVHIYLDNENRTLNSIRELNVIFAEVLTVSVLHHNYEKRYQPILPKAKINVEFCDSATNIFIQSSDLIAYNIRERILNKQKLKGDFIKIEI